MDLYFFQLAVYPAEKLQHMMINKGDKILLPPSAIQQLQEVMAQKRKNNPMIFCIKSQQYHTYCGVLEFTAEEGVCVVPIWMYKLLKIKYQGETITLALIEDIKKKKKKKQSYFVKIRPNQKKFIELDNPKAVLQFELRNFTCLHEGDTIELTHFQTTYKLSIEELKPQNCYRVICIVDIDLSVQFLPPLDYQEVIQHFRASSNKKSMKIFDGLGVRVDQKQIKISNRQAMNENQYDPRKHRIYRGVRTKNKHWKGAETLLNQ